MVFYSFVVTNEYDRYKLTVNLSYYRLTPTIYQVNGQPIDTQKSVK